MKVLSTKWSPLPIRESFLPRKFPAIRRGVYYYYLLTSYCWHSPLLVIDDVQAISVETSRFTLLLRERISLSKCTPMPMQSISISFTDNILFCLIPRPPNCFNAQATLKNWEQGLGMRLLHTIIGSIIKIPCWDFHFW